MPVGLTSDGSQIVGGPDFEPVSVPSVPSSSVSTASKSNRSHPTPSAPKAELRTLLDDQTAAYVSPPVSPHLTEIETIELGGRTLKLGRNGKFYLVERVGEGPFGEPHYAVFETKNLPLSSSTPVVFNLSDLVEDLIQALGAAIVERNGLAKKAGNS